MQNGNENLNKTAIALFRKVFDMMSFEANYGEHVWTIEVDNSTWISTCTKLVQAHFYQKSEENWM